MNNRQRSVHGKPRERAALVRLLLRSPHPVDAEVILDELAGLTRAAGADVVLRVVQGRSKPDPATLIGRGKVDALARDAEAADVDVIVVDNALTPAQARNLETMCGRRVVDRTELILDVFARRARTRAGRMQVELAQLQYALPRLTGSNTALSRLGGGIGTRGPGETKLETDRRRIRHRITALKNDIAEVGRRRAYLRARRRRSEVPSVALVGYTNAGKTTLFNWLAGADASASDALFVTLDPLMRRVRLGDGRQFLLSDTVGFIDRLPHQLVAAFHATLEEVAGADLLLHVVDASATDQERRMDAVRSVLAEVGAERVPSLDVFNKTDLIDEVERERLRARHPGAVQVSATRLDGRDQLFSSIAVRLGMDALRISLSLDDRQEGDRHLIAELYRNARVVSHVTDAESVSIEADVPRRLAGRFTRARVPA